MGEEFEIQRTDNRFSGYQKEWEDYLKTLETDEEDIKEEDIQIVIHISKNPSEEEVRRVEFYKNFIIRQGHKNVIVEEGDYVTK